MLNIKLDNLKTEISNLNKTIEQLKHKKGELNELIYRPSTFESDVRVYRQRENEVLSEIRTMSERLTQIQKEAKNIESNLAAESTANRKKEWQSITPDNLYDSINTVVDDMNVVIEERAKLNYQVNLLINKRNKVLTIIKSVDVLQDEIKVLRKQIAVLKVDQKTGKEVDDLNKAYEHKRNELNSVKEEAEHATEVLTELTTRIDALSLSLSLLDHNLKNLESTYYLFKHRKAELDYMTQVKSLMTSLRHMRAIETLIPQSRQPDISARLLSGLQSRGLLIPTFDGSTERPHRLTGLLKDLDPEINGIKVDLANMLEEEL